MIKYNFFSTKEELELFCFVSFSLKMTMHAIIKSYSPQKIQSNNMISFSIVLV